MKRPFPAYQGDEPYVFVCYAHEDTAAVYPEIQRLHEGGVRIWYDEGISPGTRWSDELARALTKTSLVLFFCTPQSVKSQHCQDEVNFALDDKRPLLVIQDGAVELPAGLRLRLGSQQSILKHELSEDQFAAKLTTAIGRHVAAGPPQAAPPTPQTPRSRRPLRYVGVIGVAVVLAALLWRFWPASTSEPHAVVSTSAATDMEFSVAVLPFRSLSSEPATLTFADGLADELVDELSGPMPDKVRKQFPALWRSLRVAPARSTLRYRNTNEDLASISQALGAGYLVEGSVRLAGERIRIAMQLIHVAYNDPIWSQTYDVSNADPLRAQTDVARRAARRIAELVPDMYRQNESLFANNAAREYYVRGNREEMDFITGGDVDVPAMIANYEKSLELEPSSWTLFNLAETYLTLMDESMQPVQTVAPIDELLTRGIASRSALDAPPPRSLFDVHRAHYSLLQLDYAKASQYLREALSDNPNDIGAHTSKSILLQHQERPEEALASGGRAVDALPTAFAVRVNLTRLLRARGNSLAAVKSIDSALELYPGDLGKAQLLIEQAQSYVALGEPDRAVALVDQAWDLSGSNHSDLFPAALASTGRAGRARAILVDLEVAGPARRFSPLDMIEGYVALGDLDAAFRWIDRAVDARFEPVVRWMHLVTVSTAGVWPKALTSDPRWQQAYARLPEVPGRA